MCARVIDGPQHEKVQMRRPRGRKRRSIEIALFFLHQHSTHVLQNEIRTVRYPSPESIVSGRAYGFLETNENGW